MRPTNNLEADLRLASRIENWQRSILLGVAGAGQIDAHLSHVIVCHAENASIRTALIETCLKQVDAEAGYGRTEAEDVPFALSRLMSMGRSVPVPLMLEMARLRLAFYRRLRMLARRAHETKIASVCDEIYRLESRFARAVHARLPATAPLPIAFSPRAASPLDALLARHVSAAAASAMIRPRSPQQSNRPQ